MKNINEDYNNIIRCLSIDDRGIKCDKDDEQYLKSLLPFISVIMPTSKRPDAFAQIDTTVLLLEHFQFDNSKVNRNGSIQNQVAAETGRKLDRILADKDFAIVDETVNKSGLFYVENFRRQFVSHSKKIENYKNEVQKETNNPFNKVIMGFVIEDASPLGSSYVDTNGYQGIDLLETKEFLDLFEVTPKLDFVIFAMTGNNGNPILSFISRNTIDNHRKIQIEVSKIQRFCFENSMCASGKIEIPNKE